MLIELTTEVIDHMLNCQCFGRIGCSADNQVLIEPVMYHFDGCHLYGRTREGAKIQMLRKNPNVAFEIDEMTSPGVWCSVVIEGEFEELHGDERDYALYLLNNRRIPLFADEKIIHTGETTSDAHKIVTPVVYRIHIKRKTGRCYKQEPSHYNQQ
jgi:nitroimidazol reductase NimA-like FMN-containing flavoprotein (pyridoxamine 5'-phosphate oxidase superfamily)